ncbi:RNA-directed DNA polymerase from mobile element jockey [Trichonephila clavipes]|nr:RNA-directed DNA polymerase from mobile element jockey [Trichonephila clavipes]
MDGYFPKAWKHAIITLLPKPAWLQGRNVHSHQLLRLTNLVVNEYNSKQATGGAFLYVEKAFDRVWQDGLIFKLIKLNFPPYIVKIVSSYLRDRSFQVRISVTLSRIGNIETGSPQGSILSRMFYSLFTYDFPTTPTVDICLFTDDATIIAQANKLVTVKKNLQGYLHKLQGWLTKWRIKINVTKSQAIVFKKGRYTNKMQNLKLFNNNIP